MRPAIHIEMEADPTHTGKKRVVLRHPCGDCETLASDLTPQLAARMLIPMRKAFLSGVQWMRDDSSSYLMSALPNIQCGVEG